MRLPTGAALLCSPFAVLYNIRMLRKALLALSIAVLAFPCASFVFAQSANQVSVAVSPTNPGPNEPVTITLSSYIINIESADIEWSLDGRSKGGGIGSNTFSLTTKNIGVSSTVTVVVTPVGNAPITKTVTITPMSVDILWQATDSVVPPLYRGKAMPTSEGSVKFVAIPQIQSTAGSLLPSNSFLYGWSEDYAKDQANSGFAKDSFLASMDYLNPTKNIGVEVSTRDGGTTAQNSISLSPRAPEVLWYASSPLYGPLFNTALSDTYNVTGSETSLIAEPYFFSPGDPTSPLLKYSWQLNGQGVETPSIPNALFLHRDSNETGSATVDLSITSVNKLFQEAVMHLNLNLQ